MKTYTCSWLSVKPSCPESMEPRTVSTCAMSPLELLAAIRSPLRERCDDLIVDAPVDVLLPRPLRHHDHLTDADRRILLDDVPHVLRRPDRRHLLHLFDRHARSGSDHRRDAV